MADKTEKIEKELTQLNQSVKRLMQGQDSLQGSLGEVTQRVATLEETKKTEAKMENQDPTQNSSENGYNPTPENDIAKMHEEAVEENARLNDQIGKLQERVAFLESEGHNSAVVQEFLDHLDLENFNQIGLNLGYLEVAEVSEEVPEGAGLEEVDLGGAGTLRMQKEKPSDPENWQYSETQKLWIQIR